MKKTVCILLAVVITAFSLTGCLSEDKIFGCWRHNTESNGNIYVKSFTFQENGNVLIQLYYGEEVMNSQTVKYAFDGKNLEIYNEDGEVDISCTAKIKEEESLTLINDDGDETVLTWVPLNN